MLCIFAAVIIGKKNKAPLSTHFITRFGKCMSKLSTTNDYDNWLLFPFFFITFHQNKYFYKLI